MAGPKQLRSIGARRFVELVDLIGRFDREAQRCSQRRAYYAACVLQGAVLEGLLLAVCEAWIDEVRTYVANLSARQRPRGQLLEWDLNQLVRVAVNLGWLPTRKVSRGPRKLGDWLMVVKELRNLVHPGRHVRRYPYIRLRHGHYADSLGIVRAATDALWSRLTADVGPALAAKARKQKN